jgi:type I restriction enzyme S subunit
VVPQGLDGANAIDILIVTPDKARLNPFYLCQFLNSVGGTRAVAASQRGQIQKHMNVASLQELRLPLPPLFLQERFAAVTAADRTLLEATRTAARQVEQLAAKCQVLGFHGAL